VVYDRIPTPPALPEGWLVRYIRPGDEDGVLAVMQASFPRWPALPISVSPLEHLRWKLSSHPSVERFHLVVEAPEGIVGARMEWAFETKIGERTLLSRESIDRAVKPAYQRKYAMSAMRTFGQQDRDRNFDMYIGYGTGISFMRNMRRYRVPAVRFERDVNIMVCDLNGAGPGRSAATWEIRPVTSFDERVDALWSSARSQFPFAVVRSSAYLNWRYADRRAGDYRLLVAEEGGRWLGYAVLRAAGTKAVVADLLTLPDRGDVAESLLGAVRDGSRDDGQQTVECWSHPHDVYRWAIDKAGFRALRRSVHLTFRPLRFAPEEAAFLGDMRAPVHFTAGDTDIV
jgi:hypothetical protein